MIVERSSKAFELIPDKFSTHTQRHPQIHIEGLSLDSGLLIFRKVVL